MTHDDNDYPSTHASNDAAWAEFVNGHSEELSDVADSRTAKKFEKKAAREEKKATRVKMQMKDFHSDVFVSAPPTPRGYSTSWLDADDTDNHFTPANPTWSSIHGSAVTAAVLLVLGFVSVFAALALPGWRMLLGSVGGVLLILGFAIFVASPKKRKD